MKRDKREGIGKWYRFKADLSNSSHRGLDEFLSTLNSDYLLEIASKKVKEDREAEVKCYRDLLEFQESKITAYEKLTGMELYNNEKGEWKLRKSKAS
jgi:hypothetical protein